MGASPAREYRAVGGNTSVLEVMTMAALLARHRPLGILEIGTFVGRTTLNLARNAPPDAHIQTIDLPEWCEVTDALDYIRQHEPAFAGLRHIQGTSLAYEKLAAVPSALALGGAKAIIGR